MNEWNRKLLEARFEEILKEYEGDGSEEEEEEEGKKTNKHEWMNESKKKQTWMNWNDETSCTTLIKRMSDEQTHYQCISDQFKKKQNKHKTNIKQT